jgi:hypothetical protein
MLSSKVHARIRSTHADDTGGAQGRQLCRRCIQTATISCVGGVAQLAERFVRNEEVVGSIPFISTFDFPT